jgi:tetratricopeptide (TPR) repeat protein
MDSFKKAISILNQADVSNDLTLKLIRVCVYCNIAINYLKNGINQENTENALIIIKKAIALLTEGKQTSNESTSYLITCKAHLIEIYNALGEYDSSLKEGEETEALIELLPFFDNDVVRAKGIIFSERGVSYLRLGKIKEAYAYFERARETLSRIIAPNYLSTLRTREAETLIRLGRENEALKICEEIFATKEREYNNYSDLSFNTCYYHAAFVEYRKGDLNAARNYFKKFFSSMKELCKKFLPKTEFAQLIEQNAFEENLSDIKKHFENSLKVFEVVYGKDRGFIEHCVKKDLENL